MDLYIVPNHLTILFFTKELVRCSKTRKICFLSTTKEKKTTYLTYRRFFPNSTILNEEKRSQYLIIKLK